MRGFFVAHILLFIKGCYRFILYLFVPWLYLSGLSAGIRYKPNPTMKVTLREKPLAGGRNRLYLDFYPPIPNPETGKPTRREFLELYTIEKPKTETDKQHNRETKKLAEAIRAKRQLDIQSQDYGFLSDDKSKADFLAYFSQVAEDYRAAKQQNNDKDKNNYVSVYRYLEKFSNGVCRFKDVTPTFCNNFKEFLQKSETFHATKKHLANNSAVGYFTIFKTVVKRAHEKGLFRENPAATVKAIKKKDTRREYLTMEELQALARTECDLPLLKSACLFSALTGLRYSDIDGLTWSKVQKSGQEYCLRFKQQKTDGQETLPISKQAYELLGEPKAPAEKVFDGLLYSSWQNMKIQQWAYRAGITKTITFHCFRHTYATLQLSLGTDIYTVSKMLGHRSLSTTQVYAKIVDKTKREAADKIKLDL